jgi:hypothetical protein
LHSIRHYCKALRHIGKDKRDREERAARDEGKLGLAEYIEPWIDQNDDNYFIAFSILNATGKKGATLADMAGTGALKNMTGQHLAACTITLVNLSLLRIVISGNQEQMFMITKAGLGYIDAYEKVSRIISDVATEPLT